MLYIYSIVLLLCIYEYIDLSINNLIFIILNYLSRHAKFYVVTSHDIINDFKLNSNDLPTIYMVSNEGEGIIKYSGEILELNLSEWVLRNSSPAMGELNLASSSGIY